MWAICVLPLGLGRLFGLLVGPLVPYRLEHLLGPRAKPGAVTVLLRDGPCEVPDDRPGGIRAELEPPRIVELLDGPDQRDVSVADQLEERLRRLRAYRLAIATTSRRFARMISFFTATDCS